MRVSSWGLARNLAQAVRKSLAGHATTREVRVCFIAIPSGFDSAEQGAVSLPNWMRIWCECINAGPSCQQKCGRPVQPERSVPVTLQGKGITFGRSSGMVSKVSATGDRFPWRSMVSFMAAIGG